MEQFPFIWDFAELPKIALEWIGRIEVMRSLHHPQPTVAHEPAECCLQERASGNVIGVKNCNVFTSRTLQRMINVPRFGVCVVAASDVACADLSRKIGELPAPTVIKHEDPDLVGRIVQGKCSQDSGPHYAKRFVVGRNENIHAGPGLRIPSQGYRWPSQGP